MEAVVTTGAISRAMLQSNHHHQQTNTQLFTGWMPFLSPNQQCPSTEGKCTFTGWFSQITRRSFSSSAPVKWLCHSVYHWWWCYGCLCRLVANMIPCFQREFEFLARAEHSFSGQTVPASAVVHRGLLLSLLPRSLEKFAWRFNYLSLHQRHCTRVCRAVLLLSTIRKPLWLL